MVADSLEVCGDAQPCAEGIPLLPCIFALRSLKEDSPLMTDFLEASYVAASSLKMEVGTSSRVWDVERRNGSVGGSRALIGELAVRQCLHVRFLLQE